MTKGIWRLAIIISVVTAGFTLLGRKAPALAATACEADVNQDTVVDLTDYSLLAADFFKTTPTSPRSDINQDGLVDLQDYSLMAANFFNTCTVTQATTEWTQFGGNAQHTSYSPDIPALSWKYKWQWNGADTNGKAQSNHVAVKDLIQPISGGNRVYMVANNSLYALDANNGNVLWTKGGIGTLNGTPAYLSESVYLPSSDGHVYKINATNGSVTSSFTGSGAFNDAVLLVGQTVYAGTLSGNFYAIDTNNMSQLWKYTLGSAAATPASYSATRNLVIINSQDLYVHAINASSGSLKWKVKPTPRTYQSGNPTSTGAQFERGWPVIADKTGIVLVRYRLDWNSLWAWNPFPTTNAEIRAGLQSKPDQQALYALSLDSGNVAFIPAVGNGGEGDGGTLPMGTQPVIKEYNGKEVAYIIWRNGLTCASGWCDGREDATMGEMVLDNNTVPGYVAGDVRFVKWIDIQTDEMMYITMGNDILFESHWLINAAERITDRSNNLGSTFASPINTANAPFVIWRQCYCPPSNPTCNPIIYPGGSGSTTCGSNCPFNAGTRYCSTGLYSYGDQRSYPPGFYEYHNDQNSGSIPFTIPTKNLVLVKTIDGGIIALANGNPTAAQANTSPESTVAGIHTTNAIVDPFHAKDYISSVITVQGKVEVVDNHLPKAMYIGFKNPHDGALLVRIFNTDLTKFKYDVSTLKGKTIQVTGLVTLYWPEGKDPEIVVTNPAQIKVVSQ